jgi:hypothetical protein
MNRRTDSEKLLADVLSETVPADFRDAMFGETLRLVRRRRRWRQTRQVAGVFAIAGLLTILVRQNWSEQSVILQPLAETAVKTNYKLVHTEPLPGDAVVTTRPFSDSQLIASGATVVEVVTTGGGFRQINDDELLALVSGRAAVLIRTGPHSEELVFANPEDQKDFLGN